MKYPRHVPNVVSYILQSLQGWDQSYCASPTHHCQPVSAHQVHALRKLPLENANPATRRAEIVAPLLNNLTNLQNVDEGKDCWAHDRNWSGVLAYLRACMCVCEIVCLRACVYATLWLIMRDVQVCIIWSWLKYARCTTATTAEVPTWWVHLLHTDWTYSDSLTSSTIPGKIVAVPINLYTSKLWRSCRIKTHTSQLCERSIMN